jgi:LysR family glycine cleavage system transcriptional activator
MSGTPPLNALRAFEAAARTGSFTAAAHELGVSSPAVSQQVKQLEDFWQQALFIRQGNRLSLTDAGQTAYPQLGQAMSSLSALSDRMRNKKPRRSRLVLSAPHSVAETWLASRLAQLAGAEELAPIDIRVDDDPVDFARDKIDMRIFFGHDLYGDYHVEPLFTDRLIAVASPDLVRRFGSDIMGMPDDYIIHTNWGKGFASSPNWETVLEGERIVDRDRGMSVQSSSTALSFAKHALGVALVPSVMAEDDINTGRVLQLKVPTLELRSDYRIALPKRIKSNANVARVLEVLARA